MNLSNRLMLLLLVTVLALSDYYQSLSLKKSGVVDIFFYPPLDKPHVHHNSSRNNNGLSIEDIANQFNLTTPNPQTSGRLAPQRRNGTRFNSPFKYQDNGDHWWTYTDSCFAVDHVCRIPRNRWFYFHNSSIDDKKLRTSGKRKWQPSFELKYMPQSYRRGLFANTLIQMSISSSHQISWEEISALCIIDDVPYHVVLQSLFNDMIGEFYSRTLLYMHKLLSVAPTLREMMLESNNIINSTSTNQPPVENTQYYVHITMTDKKLLDAHKLFLSGMHGLNTTQYMWTKSAGDLFLPENDNGCQCYEKIVFCGYDTYVEQDIFKLWPGKYVDTLGDEIEGDSPCNPVNPSFTKFPDQCQEYAKLKSYVLANIETNFPKSNEAILHFRRSVLMESARSINGNYDGDTKEWAIVGLTQRYSRRKWLNLPSIIEDCNTRFYNQKVVCVEVNVEDSTSPEEQFILHAAMDALVGIHGAQLTQAILLSSGSHILELLPWIPVSTKGGWTKRTNRPTPLGIIFHNTDLNHYGYSLNRSSVPLCEDAPPELDKECLMSDSNKLKFNWDVRDFVVESGVVIRFIEKFILQREQKCNTLQAEEEFVLYNVWCRDDITEDKLSASNLRVRHFYREKQAG